MRIGGIHRLHLLQSLLPYVDKINIFSHPEEQSNTWQLYFGGLVFSLSLSHTAYRGFSAEGALLELMMEDLPAKLIQTMDNYSFSNQAFNVYELSKHSGEDLGKIEYLSAKLSAMGLLGYDLDLESYYYRRLPFKMERILALHPRLKGAQKLLSDNKVTLVFQNHFRVEARVEGSGVQHTVLFDEKGERCTCLWHSRTQGKGGDCKHILAVKKKIKEK